MGGNNQMLTYSHDEGRKAQISPLQYYMKGPEFK